MLREDNLCVVELGSCGGSDLIGNVEMWWETEREPKVQRTGFHSGSKQILNWISSLPAAIGHHLKTLTINFTITNLPYSSNMSNASALFSSTESVLQYLVRPFSQQPGRDWSHITLCPTSAFISLLLPYPQLGHMFQNDSFNSSCRLDSLRWVSFLSLCKEWTLLIFTILIPPPSFWFSSTLWLF